MIIIFSTGFNFWRIDYREGMYKNICKDLRNNVLIYLRFVDSKTTSPWMEFDFRFSNDSMRNEKNKTIEGIFPRWYYA